ncbi:MAG: zinc ribbon domain-containing protein [Deltaproteobacteria bacterium]|jgi:putative FmdB family regulatory protein|nr:zinc ribbon domain-containing protein [Deltaproteobacteria bacterium]
MPIYEYECESCHKITEASQKITDPPLTVCPNCQGHLQKLISRTTFQLKGTGWFASDYKNRDDNTPQAPKKGPEEGEKKKSYLDQNAEERKSTIKEITTKVANNM